MVFRIQTFRREGSEAFQGVHLRVDAGTLGQSKAKGGHAKQSKAEHCKPRQRKAKQSNAMQGAQGKGRPRNVKRSRQGKAKQSSKRGQARESDAKHGKGLNATASLRYCV